MDSGEGGRRRSRRRYRSYPCSGGLIGKSKDAFFDAQIRARVLQRDAARATRASIILELGQSLEHQPLGRSCHTRYSQVIYSFCSTLDPGQRATYLLAKTIALDDESPVCIEYNGTKHHDHLK